MSAWLPKPWIRPTTSSALSRIALIRQAGDEAALADGLEGLGVGVVDQHRAGLDLCLAQEGERAAGHAQLVALGRAHDDRQVELPGELELPAARDGGEHLLESVPDHVCRPGFPFVRPCPPRGRRP